METARNWAKKITVGGAVFGMLFAINNGVGNIRSAIDNGEGVYQVATGALAWVQGRDKVKPNDIEEEIVRAISEAADCNFKPKEWDGGAGRLEREKESTVYRMPPGVYSSNIRYERSVPSRSKTIFTFTPETELINTSILYHDLFEVVVGDGDQFGVTIKANQDGGIMRRLGKRIILPGGIKVGNDVSVEISQTPLANGEHEVILSVSYIGRDGPPGRVTDFRRFRTPSEFKNTDKAILISVGFLNTDLRNREETKANFKCFKISQDHEEQTFSRL